ncbi:MAG: carboxypeptidase M32 [Rhodospirillaceae bacterium]|nr:carboxypeptidase M32 [Rhodospirillaceae bacterium]
MEPYRELERRFRRIANIEGASAILQWDWATMMPPGGADSRAEQLATLSVLHHELITDPAMGDLIAAAEADGAAYDEWQSANLREMKRKWRHAVAVPASLVDALSRQSAKTEMVWREARANDDFATFAPALGTLLGLVREKAAAKAAAFGCSPYDALLDGYEPGGSSARIDTLFDDLAEFLPDFLEGVLEHQGRGPALLPFSGPFPVAKQEELGRRLMGVLKFPFDRGRLDVSHHPFSGGTPDDLRITTRYDEQDFMSSLMGVLHETGHALYELNLPQAWRYQPVGDARGMSIHESQSLLVEMQACRSREFITFVAPLMRDAFGGDGPAWEPENLHRHYTRVERSLIRVDADEVTYPAHVILRYRLEKEMIDGDLAVADLPEAWNAQMQSLLGVTPPNDRLGCLQDIHWAGGDFGYFPTYTLGAMTAAQLFDAACRQDSDILPSLGRGDSAPLQAWLKENVHGVGSRLETEDLIALATGEPLTDAVYKRHLKNRYLS